MAAIMLLLAYILPLPIAGACLYFHVFDNVQDIVMRLVYIAAVSLTPSALLMIFALKRIVHFIFHFAIYAVVFYGLYHFGLIGHATSTR
jgi:hypothetical protein